MTGLRSGASDPPEGPSAAEGLDGRIGPVLAVLSGCAEDNEVMETAAYLARRHKAGAIALLAMDVPRSKPLQDNSWPPVDPELRERLGEAASRLGLQLEVAWGRDRLQTLLRVAWQRGAIGLVTIAWPNPYLPGRLHDDSLALLSQAPCTVWLIRHDWGEDREAKYTHSSKG